jgi:hypothetical protein
MSNLRSDMSGLGRICPVWSPIFLVKLDLSQRKSRSGDKTMNLGPNKLTTSKLGTKKLRKKRKQQKQPKH